MFAAYDTSDAANGQACLICGAEMSRYIKREVIGADREECHGRAGICGIFVICGFGWVPGDSHRCQRKYVYLKRLL